MTHTSVTFVPPLFLHCSSVVPPLQSRCKFDANSMEERRMSELGALSQCRNNGVITNVSIDVFITKSSLCNVATDYSARLEGQQTVEIRPEVGGMIKKICIHEGDKVKRGQVLFVINPVPYRTAYDEASANVKSAEALWQHKTFAYKMVDGKPQSITVR